MGLVASKIQYLPANIITPIFNIASVALYLLGYSLWLVNSYFYPNQTPKYNKWYGFAAFKEQNAHAAALGILATLTGVVAIALPVFALPAAWLFFTSNVIWCISEFHKLKNPPPDKEYSESYQKSYLSYAISMSSVSVVGALATTLMFLIPPLYLPVLVVSTLLSVALVATAIGYWLDYTFNQHKKTPITKSSYESISEGLGDSLDLQESLDNNFEPYHGNFLHKSAPKRPVQEIELVTLENSPSTANSYGLY